jgi:hypothetical protein
MDKYEGLPIDTCLTGRNVIASHFDRLEEFCAAGRRRADRETRAAVRRSDEPPVELLMCSTTEAAHLRAPGASRPFFCAQMVV